MSEGWPRGEEDTATQTASHGEPSNHTGGQVGWLMYEWANQPYFSLITIFLFSNYFANVFFQGDAADGQAYWGYTQAIAGIAIALMSPILGAMADAAGPRKPFIGFFLLGVSFGCVGLWIAEPGGALLPIMALVIVASISAEFVTTFANAMLPNISTERRMALLSGVGYGIAQVAGIFALAIVLFAFQLPGNIEASFIPDAPLLGLDRSAYEDERIVGPLAGLWFLVFMLPLFLLTPDQPKTGLKRGAAARQGIRQLRETFRRLRHFRNIGLYLIARMLYYDGCTAVFMFGGIIAGALFGWSALELAVFGIVVTLFSALGGFLGGVIDARIGSKRTIVGALLVVILTSVALVSVDSDTMFFVLEVAPRAEGAAPFSSAGEIAFLVIACLFGLGVGPALASSRTMLARLAPRDMMAEFFGLYALAGKATTFLAPLTIGIVTQATGNQRLGLSIVLVFLLAGLALMFFVKEERSEGLHA
ncbi:Major facilitator superfamily MFS_1 [Candidatus Phaeomarinobacter ectocarpi]|uniref:Major facilitator superfamily MFS_1 n=1 Tax=Candidatus Phaeomarinibacter ectocarpi TaxID=1458461 RepID=X5MLP8_9HYPH|nr:MFS transporter [Candidatus Phaeomarinobacter ectocarpi]CDO59665.1 Major facilitator superfamily MFS_1 [Candidatus Phaeomarinobacter ectocarpi]